uniref:CWH43-like N-terminal domain-containing protein n=1 Tax=Clastoptera arizonana TaxID=38151 RepID=A0A1B6C5M8_9HEMI
MISSHAFLLIYIRHCQLIEYTRCRPKTGPQKLNIYVSTTIGYISCMGLFFDANFQETSQKEVHMFSAKTCIYSSIIYYTFQTVYSYWTVPELNSIAVFYCRAGITFFNYVFIMIALTVREQLSFYIMNHSVEDYMHWSPDVPGWPVKVMSCAMEWLIVLSFQLYMLTYYPEFKRVQMGIPSIQPIELEQDSPMLISFAFIRHSFRYPAHRKTHTTKESSVT